MRLLFTFAGGNGHFVPLLPLAAAAQRAGHVVAFGCQAAMLAPVEDAGFTAFETGGATLRDSRSLAPLLELNAEREDRAIRDTFAGRVARERASAILKVCARWQPDLVVRDEVDFGSAVAAERCRLPHASVLVMAAGSFVRPELVAEPLHRLRAEHGLAPDPTMVMLSRDLVLSPFPPSYRDPADPLPATAHSLRPAGLDAARGDAAPNWLANLPHATTAYVTLGTVFNLESGDLFDRLLAGLRDLRLNVVVTVGREIDPCAFGPQPPNVRIEPYVAQALLLPHCNLVVSHAGSGSVMGALAHGLPMVLLPLGADQPLNAARCEQLGVAQVLDAVRATPEQIGQAVSGVLADSTYRQAAERLRDEIAALPTAAYGVKLLERLAADTDARSGRVAQARVAELVQPEVNQK